MATKTQPLPIHRPATAHSQPHVVLVAPRGEALRNFVYSDTLRVLSENARVTVLSVVDDDQILSRFRSQAKILPLRYYREHPAVAAVRGVSELAHFRHVWSEVAREVWQRRIDEATTPVQRLRRRATNAFAACLAHQPGLRALDSVERSLSWRMRRTEEFVRMFGKDRPDIVFNCSHIHGPAAEEPLRAAERLGIPTAGFIFSWDNLTSRSRIHTPYDYYLVWHEKMRRDLLRIYPHISADRVIVTGTPQFDFHFKPEFMLDRDDLCQRIGADPARPIVLYTAGMDTHFPEEHRTVEAVARMIQRLPHRPKPQLVVRTYIKGTSPEMQALAERRLEDVVFPRVLWTKQWLTPLYEDFAVYAGMLRHADLGINVASTVSLELLLHKKPVINLGFDPPGANLPHSMRYERHLLFDHYRPVAESGAVMIARSEQELELLIRRGLDEATTQKPQASTLLEQMFGDMLDGRSGRRVATTLLDLATGKKGLAAHA
jgi:hypothetical protein